VPTPERFWALTRQLFEGAIEFLSRAETRSHGDVIETVSGDPQHFFCGRKPALHPVVEGGRSELPFEGFVEIVARSKAA
jgi:hypothetical protein